MSGHSKWATTHRQKEANDSKRGAVFTKIGNMITIAVKEGGGIGDPDKNFKLRLVVDKAREANMPKENIQRAIDRATGAGSVELAEAIFEGFLPGGVGVLVQTLSDNKLRSAQQVREVLDKNGATVASSGAVSHGFKLVGELGVAKGSGSTQEDELKLMDISGIEDIEEADGEWLVWCDKAKLFEVKTQVEAMGLKVISAEQAMKPDGWIDVGDRLMQEKIEGILMKLDELDDVSKVWTNYHPV